jgi:mevalonate kinase
MTSEQKQPILDRISEILDKIEEPTAEKQEDVCEIREMLTIPECVQTIKGLSTHTLRLLITRGEIPSFRAGEGKTGKILVPKASLLSYFDKLPYKSNGTP